MKALIISLMFLLAISTLAFSDEPQDVNIAQLKKTIEDQEKTIQRAEKMVDGLKRQIAELEKENRRLLTLCKKAGIDSTKDGLQNDPNSSKTQIKNNDITFQELKKLFGPNSSLTSIQQDELFKEYSNKTIRWTGKLQNVFFQDILIEVHFMNDQEANDIRVAFPKAYKDKFLKLKKGSTVTYEARLPKEIGGLVAIGHGHLYLTDGQIISIGN